MNTRNIKYALMLASVALVSFSAGYWYAAINH